MPATGGERGGKHGDQDQGECEHGREIPRLRGDFPDGENAGAVWRSRFQVA
jgi:hypothetical protein